jgi:predicted nucleic acid-binding protein
VITCDTSVLVAAFARWHVDHAVAAAAVDRLDAVIDHVAVETYSVLTRLPAPRRVAPDLVTAFLAAHAPLSAQRLGGVGSAEVLGTAERSGITGGAVYDLVVALSAARAGARLLSLDRRAASTYDAADVRYELLS